VLERWPGLRLAPGTEVFVQDDGGVCMAERTVRAQARLASEAGATIREGVRIDRIETNGDAVTVHAEGGSYRAGVVVVTAGPWAGDLLRTVGIDLPLVPSFEQVTYFALEEPTPLPTVIDWDVNPPHTPYAVPNPEEPGRFKVALHMSGPPVDADARSFEADAERVAKVTAYAETRFAPHRAEGGTDTCLYTNTPDEHFLLDRRGPVVIGSPCSGHGFKFAPLIGRILASLATGDPPPVPVERFRAARFPERRTPTRTDRLPT
jgi:sarcosine oxidase